MKVFYTSIISIVFVFCCSLNLNAQHHIWINEFSYDDSGIDDSEFIEVAGKANIDLSQYQLYLINGTTTQVGSPPYLKINLKGLIPNEKDNFGVVDTLLGSSSLQNGPFDGIALVYKDSLVVQFISYEGKLSSYVVNNSATEIESTNIAQFQNSTLADDTISIQLTGNETIAPSFTWTKAVKSPGKLNAGQDPKNFVLGLYEWQQIEALPFDIQNNNVISNSSQPISILDVNGKLLESLTNKQMSSTLNGIYIIQYFNAQHQPVSIKLLF